MKLKIAILATALGAGLALPASAGVDDRYPDSRGRQDIAKVIRVEPIVRIVRISEPRRRCWDEEYIVRVDDRRGHGSTAGGAILGGIIGGAVGNAVGSGRGRDAATVAGVLIGSSIGHDRAVRDNARYGVREEVRTRTRCEVEETWREEERIEGYDVTYQYQGETYRARMSHDPGRELRVWVSVRPVGE